jgi:hypothetical protein
MLQSFTASQNAPRSQRVNHHAVYFGNHKKNFINRAKTSNVVQCLLSAGIEGRLGVQFPNATLSKRNI